jgi:hypothetical protein
VCSSYKELTDAQFGITPKIVCPTTCRIWIVPSFYRPRFLHLIIHVRYVKGQTILLLCDNCNGGYHLFRLNQSSLKFLQAFGIIHHVFRQHLIFYSNHVTFSRLRFGGEYMKISFQSPIMHYIYIYICVCVCVHLFLVD